MEDNKILQYKDLIKIKEGEDGNPLVVLQQVAPMIKCQYEKDDMFSQTGDDILVRGDVANKLVQVANNLKAISGDYKLKVVYGYRSPDIQKKYFDKRKEELQTKYNEISNDELLELTHSFVAFPDVAGHVTGGAIDLTIESLDQSLDMGSEIANYSDEDIVKTFSKKITTAQLANRLLLRDLMMAEGFAPFYGEWWHFSYGDREWASFYNKNSSLYSKIVL